MVQEADLALAMMVPSNARNRVARNTALVYSDEIAILAGRPAGMETDAAFGFLMAFDFPMKACLLVRSEGPRIDSLSQLAEKPAVRPLLFANSILVSMLGRSTRPDWHHVWLMVERHGGLVPIEALYASSHLDAVARGSAVILSDRTSFRYVVGRTCARFPNSQFYIGKEPVNTLSFGLYANARLPHEFRRKMDQR
ncbi:unnamed protein product [Ixodes persulcatus]